MATKARPTRLALAPGIESSVPFDLQPILKGELLTLRPLRPEDFPELYVRKLAILNGVDPSTPFQFRKGRSCLRKRTNNMSET
jgi:hypothetical protein